MVITDYLRIGKSAAVIFSVAALMAACGGKVLEAENATVKNGKIYRDGADKPFSGRVTNLPEKVIIPRQISAEFMAPFHAAGNVSALAFGADNSVCDTDVKNGVPIGTTICKYPRSETVRYELTFKDGMLEGNAKMHGPAPSNHLLVSASFDEGKLHGRHEAFNPTTGTKIFEGTWKAGILDGSETIWHLDGGKLLLKAFHRDGKLEGPVLRYAKDGTTVVYRGNFANGLKEGLEEVFSIDGNPASSTQWRSGKKHGSHRDWLWRDGLPRDYQCVEDVCTEVAKAPVNSGVNGSTDSCVDRWTTAHRKVVGQEAVVSQDQIEEWKGWCSQGKVPG